MKERFFKSNNKRNQINRYKASFSKCLPIAYLFNTKTPQNGLYKVKNN